MPTREEVKAQLMRDYPQAIESMVDVLVDLWLKDPEWIKQEAKRLQKEDMKKGKKKQIEEPTPKQSVFANVSIEEPLPEAPLLSHITIES